MKALQGSAADSARSTSIADLAEVLGYPARLRVLFDARKLGDGGIGTYIEGMIESLLAIAARSTQLWASPLNPSTKLSRFPHAELTLLVDPNHRGSYPWMSQVNVIPCGVKPYSLNEMFLLARQIPWERFDVFHVPHYTLPFGVPIPSVVTLHDVIHVNHPERWYYPLIGKRLIASAISRATRVIAVSRSTQDDLNTTLSLPRRLARRVRIVSNAVDPFFLLSNPATETEAKVPYLLAISSMDKPHKGLHDLLDAWELVLLKGANSFGGQEVRLVLGGYGWQNKASDVVQRAERLRAVDVKGALSRHALRELYHGAHALVVPSRAEGFCVPVLEAHASGTPVIARPIPAVKELLTEFDIETKDFSVAALADGISAMIQASGIKSHTKQSLPLRVAKQFDRESIGRALLQVYSEAMLQAEKDSRG